MTEDYDAEIAITQRDADAEEYPTCYECDSPMVRLAHTDGIGLIATCTDPDCRRGLEKSHERQIPNSMVKLCVDEVGVENLREEMVEKVEMLNEYRSENGMETVEVPPSP